MNTNTMFYRVDENGNAAVFMDSGEAATRIDANVYPINSDFSARYEHPDGIVLTVADAGKIGITEGGYVDVYQTVDDALDNVSSKSFGGAV